MTDWDAGLQEPVEPRLAATIILLRDGEAGLEVLVLQKASGKHFAAGALVFPGGTVDSGDVAYAGKTLIDEDPFRTLKVAAIREMFEECAIVLARRPGEREIVSETEARELAALNPSRGFVAMIEAAGLELATDQLVRVAHWITPPVRPKRFDTHFFIAPAPAGQIRARVDGYEIVDANWHRPSDLLDKVHAGELQLVLPTMMNLLKLSHRRTVDEAMRRARGEQIVTVSPVRKVTDEGAFLTIPEEAGYGVTEVHMDKIRRS